MARYSYTDIVAELSELCRDIVNDIRQQLNYYRASVYKDETSRLIIHRVEKLRLVAKLTYDDGMQEAFDDHDAVKAMGAAAYVPGECSFSARTTTLCSEIEERANELIHLINCRALDSMPKSFARNIQKHRRELLAICRQGSRQWAFFQTL